MRTSVWLVRHGQTTANRERRYQSVGNSPITPYGQQQQAALAQRLRRLPFTVALASPTVRTEAMAAAILAGRTNVVPQHAPAWAETHHGRWEGLTYREVLARYPDEAQARWAQGIDGKAQGGESLAEINQRVMAAWHDVLAQHVGERVLVATHATPIQLVLCAAFGLAPSEHWHWRIDLGSVTCLDVYPTGAIVRVVNEVPRIGNRG